MFAFQSYSCGLRLPNLPLLFGTISNKINLTKASFAYLVSGLSQAFLPSLGITENDNPKPYSVHLHVIMGAGVETGGESPNKIKPFIRLLLTPYSPPPSLFSPVFDRTPGSDRDTDLVADVHRVVLDRQQVLRGEPRAPRHFSVGLPRQGS